MAIYIQVAIDGMHTVQVLLHISSGFQAPTQHGDISLATEVKAIDIEAHSAKKQRVPRRLIHFSDGIVEEYSTDDEEEDEVDIPQIDPVSPLRVLSYFVF